MSSTLPFGAPSIFVSKIPSNRLRPTPCPCRCIPSHNTASLCSTIQVPSLTSSTSPPVRTPSLLALTSHSPSSIQTQPPVCTSQSQAPPLFSGSWLVSTPSSALLSDSSVHPYTSSFGLSPPTVSLHTLHTPLLSFSIFVNSLASSSSI
eukprot:TRINITY_DN30311_c0_g1_i1.p2 TRINITY_DN30311_c0_g1~~TRINITY_DN30311_c0_g1_i1.p2  ORF type:complete len:149 (-),score=8.76 TRINITY_DN30311_c0_g1_i1:259-705(-)